MNLRHLAPKASALPTAPHLDRLLFLETKIIKALLWSPSCGARNACARYSSRRISTAAPKSPSLFPPPAAVGLFAQSTRATNCATPRDWENEQRSFSRGGHARGTSNNDAPPRAPHLEILPLHCTTIFLQSQGKGVASPLLQSAARLGIIPLKDSKRKERKR